MAALRLKFDGAEREQEWNAYVDRETRGPVARGLVLFAVVLLLAIPGDYWQAYAGWQAVAVVRVVLWAPIALVGAWLVARGGLRVLDVTLGVSVALTLSLLGLMLFAFPRGAAIDFPMYWAVLLLLVHLVTPLGVVRSTAAGATVVASFFTTMLYHEAARRELSAHAVFLLFSWALLIGASWLLELRSRQAFRARADLLDRTREIAALTQLQASVLDTLGDGVVGLTREGRVAFANAAAERFLRAGALVGASFHDRFHAAEEPAPGRCPVCIAAAPVQDLPTRLHLADGARRSVECSARPNGDGTQPVARVLSFRDTEQRRALEARLREAQRMESIGRFVGGVAHEFNNLLTPIVGGMSVARAALGPDHSLHATLGNLERAGERAAGLVRQLLASGRRIELAREPVDLTATIRQVLALLRPTLDRRITVSFQPSRDAWVLADPGQVHQVVLNLCLNARDAVAAHAAGPMAISVATRRLAPEETGGRTGEWIELDVSDTGPGIPADVLPRIWEPFFTTKRLGDGSGLGLAVTHGIVTQHGGWIAVETEVGRGASFRCAFPAAAARDAPEPEPAPAGRAHGGAAILVVDDEELVRSTIRTMLEPVGYDVHEADCGEAAVARLAEGFRPDAILLDLLMPGIDGWDTLVAIRSIVGAIPVIVISGYDARHSGAIGPTGVAPEPEARLSKPFQVAALMDTLASVIRRDRPASV